MRYTDEEIKQYETRFRAAEKALDEAWKENDKMFSNKTSDGLRKGVKPEEFQASLEKVTRLGTSALGAFDQWQYAIKHQHDKVGVPVEDVRGILVASFSDKVSDLKFNVNSGVLASNVARAIHMDAQEAELDVPYCADHS